MEMLKVKEELNAFEEDCQFILSQSVVYTHVLLGWQVKMKDSLTSLLQQHEEVSCNIQNNIFIIMDLRKNPFNRKTEYLLVTIGSNNNEISVWIRLNRGEKKTGYDFTLLRKVV